MENIDFRKVAVYAFVALSVFSLLSIFEDVENSSKKAEKQSKHNKTKKKVEVETELNSSSQNRPNSRNDSGQIQEKQEVNRRDLYFDKAIEEALRDPSLSCAELQRIIAQLQAQCEQKENQFKAESKLRKEAEDTIRLLHQEHDKQMQLLQAELNRERKRTSALSDQNNILETKLNILQQQSSTPKNRQEGSSSFLGFASPASYTYTTNEQ
jgi:chromosome segregation ATPase